MVNEDILKVRYFVLYVKNN